MTQKPKILLLCCKIFNTISSTEQSSRISPEGCPWTMGMVPQFQPRSCLLLPLCTAGLSFPTRERGGCHPSSAAP